MLKVSWTFFLVNFSYFPFKVKAPSLDKAAKILGVMYPQHTYDLQWKSTFETRRQRSLVLWDLQMQA